MSPFDTFQIIAQVVTLVFGLWMTFKNTDKSKYIKRLENTIRRYEIEEVIKDEKISNLQEECDTLAENCGNLLEFSKKKEERQVASKERIKAISSGSTRLKLKYKPQTNDTTTSGKTVGED